MFIWNTHSLPHSLLICICLLACLLARTATIYNTYTMILAKRSRVYTVLLKQTNIWLCTIKNKQLIALLSVLFRFLHYFVIRCFDVRIEWTLCDGWSALSRRPSYVSPCMRCCFSFCLCEAFGGYKCARTHTMSTPIGVCFYFEIGSHKHIHILPQRVTQTNARGNAFTCVSLTMSKSPVFRCCRVAQYSM